MLSALLDVAIGIILLYIILSIFASAANEMLAALLRSRSKSLRRFIQGLLLDSRMEIDKFYNHPMIITQRGTPFDFPDNQARVSHVLPDYIKSTDFAAALLDMTVDRAITDQTVVQRPSTLEEWQTMIDNMKDMRLKKVMQAAFDKAVTLDHARQNLEQWFDSSMDRVSAWYKRRTQLMILIISAVVAFGFNVDTLAIANQLLQSPAVRNSLVEQAKLSGQELKDRAAAVSNINNSQVGTADQASAFSNAVTGLYTLEGLNIPLGWPDQRPPRDYSNPLTVIGYWLLKLIGLMATTLAMTQGAPFWFDMLNRVTNLRATGKPPEKSTPATTTTTTSTTTTGAVG